MAFTLSTEYVALKNDVNALFSRFYQKQSVRFEDFALEWKEMNFNCIFAATQRSTLSARTRIVERLYRVASEFLSEDSTFLYRVAAIYMFYAVYFRQITDYKVKIRMTPTMWKDLMDFYGIVMEHQHLDVAYVIQVLRSRHAFVFTAFPKFLVFGRHEFMLGIEGASNLRHTYEADKYVNDLLESNEILDSLESIQKDYVEIKEKLLQESKEEEKECLSKVLFYSNAEFPEEFKKMVKSFKGKHKTGSLLKPELISDSTQRPVLSQLQEIKESYEEQDTGVKQESRLQVISGIIKKSWKTSACSPHERKQNALKDFDAAPNSEPDENVVFKKSAMLQPIVKPKRAKTTLNSKSIRYQVKQKSEDL